MFQFCFFIFQQRLTIRQQLVCIFKSSYLKKKKKPCSVLFTYLTTNYRYDKWLLNNEVLNIFSVYRKVLQGGKENVIKNNYLLAIPPEIVASEMTS